MALLKQFAQDTQEKRPRVAERRRRSAARAGHANCAREEGGNATCAADHPTAWLIPGRVAVLIPLTRASGAPLGHIRACRFRGGQMQNGAEEKRHPHFVRQVMYVRQCSKSVPKTSSQ